MDEAALRAMLPMGFGKQRASAPKISGYATGNSSDDDAGPSSSKAPMTKLVQGPASGPMAAVKKDPAAQPEDDLDDDGLTAEERAANQAALDAEDSDDDDDEDGNDSDSSADLGPEPIGLDSDAGIPLESEIRLQEHAKALSALAVDSSGARIATGSYDYDVRLWDFGGMSSSFKPFKTFEPFGSYWIHDLAWSNSGDQLLAVSGTAQPKLYDREGNNIATFKQGDPYLRDMKHTAGHVAEVTSCKWLPHESNTFSTASADSTIRLWDPENPLKQKLVISVKSKDRGSRTKVTTHAWSNDGKTLAAGCLDGALHIWSSSGSYSRTNATIEGAHVKGTETSSVVFSSDGRTLASRGGDDTVKLWDTRAFKKPLAEKGGLPNHFAQTSVIFSSDERNLLTGTSAVKKGSGANQGRLDEDDDLSSGFTDGAIEVFSRLDLSPVKTIPIPATEGSSSRPTSVIRLQWHPKINQLFASTSTGSCSVFYSQKTSIRGALLCVGKAPQRQYNRAPSEEFSGPIITPGARDAESRGQGMSFAAKKRRMEKARQDPVLTRIPQRPMDGPGKGGRIGVAATGHVHRSLFNPEEAREDPREALLKYAEEGKKNPRFTAAWGKTQPETQYRQEDEGE